MQLMLSGRERDNCCGPPKCRHAFSLDISVMHEHIGKCLQRERKRTAGQRSNSSALTSGLYTLLFGSASRLARPLQDVPVAHEVEAWT